MNFTHLFAQFMSLAGVAALIVTLINIGKTFGWVKDGQAPKISLILSTLGFVALSLLSVFKPEVNVGGLDAGASEISKWLLYFLGFAIEIGLPGKIHQMLSNSDVPVVGKSFSKDDYGYG